MKGAPNITLLDHVVTRLCSECQFNKSVSRKSLDISHLSTDITDRFHKLADANKQAIQGLKPKPLSNKAASKKDSSPPST
jgi:hypothetical protein